MPIAIHLRKENGETLNSAHEAPDEGQVLPILNPAEFPMLGHVDPFGNTIFNRSQMREIVAEIDRLVGEPSAGGRRIGEPSVDERQAEFLLKVKELCAEGLTRQHRFLWFLGD